MYEGIYFLVPIMDRPHYLTWRESEPAYAFGNRASGYRYKQKQVHHVDLREAMPVESSQKSRSHRVVVRPREASICCGVVVRPP